MKLFIVACLLSIALAEKKEESTTSAPPKASEKPQSFQHQSSLKDNTNQHLDSQQDTSTVASAEEYRQLSSEEVKQLLLKVHI